MTRAAGIVGEFFSLKGETDADLLAMQCGDFYEFFAEDAELVGEELDLKVSQKSSGGSSYAMAGVPVDDLTPYLTALVERGYRVAVADQYETDGGHAREVVRVVTPGTLIEGQDASARFLAAIVDAETLARAGSTGRAPSRGSEDGGRYGLALVDVTTGQFVVTALADREELRTECYRFDPVEVLPGPTLRDDGEFLEWLEGTLAAEITLIDAERFAPGRATRRAREQFGADRIDRLSVADPAIVAAGAALAYVEESGVGVLAAMTRIRTHRGEDHVSLDATTQRNLELTETMQGESAGSLLETIDHTVTAPGRRRLREWLCRPRRSIDALERRQDAVDALASAAMAREAIRDALGEAYDLERLAAKAARGSADARDLLAVRDSLGILPDLSTIVREDQGLAGSPLAERLEGIDAPTAGALCETLEEALVEEPPATVTEGGLFRNGYDAELDELIERHEELQGWFDALADRETARHGLSHVSVDRNATDGYYVQVGKSVADEVPEHYEEIKTLKNSKRFRTDELAERERELVRVEERRAELEYELFENLRARVADHAELCQDVGRTIAAVDVLTALATHAAENGWVRPELHEGDEIDVTAGRHPVVETTTEFVPNDVRLDADRRFLIVTGPNMSGKSTYLRQVATITLLAQVGSFVPAREARIGLVDGIFTRVGALDELAQGRSTFMVEMSELSHILHAATEDSLVILDEVGRGTATYDGISIAWASTEYLHNEVRAKTLFATHYHELTSLAEHLPRVANVHVAADERDGDVTFLRTVRDGPTDRSYGIHVADLAGVPDPVVDRSRTVLERLREEQAIEARGGSSDEPVQAVFDLASESMQVASAGPNGEHREGRSDAGDGSGGDRTTARIGPAGRDPSGADRGERSPGPEIDDMLEELHSIDVNESAPIDVVAKVREWQRRLEEGEDS